MTFLGFLCLLLLRDSSCVIHSIVYVQPSFDKVVPPSFYELGLAELVCIYNELREIGKAPPVIDAAELQQDPEVLSELCEHA